MADTRQLETPAGLPPTAVCYALFVLSGFAGLVYETTWARYLKNFLGHEAYAQALVLVIFLGGLAIGAAITSRYTGKLRAPLLGYAVVEAVLALSAIAFHDMFVIVRGLLEGGLGGSAPVRWLAGTLLILPQSMLLGATFPLLSAALVRGRRASSGKVVALLYATNSIGGCIGALLVGTVLVELGGLPGTMFIGGLASAVAGLVAWVLHHRCVRAPALAAVPRQAGDARDIGLGVLVLVAAGTGLASLVYEVVWVRMLALVLGSSSRAFELMLAAFIFGLAAGGYYTRNWPDRPDRLRVLAHVQLAMGALAIVGLFYYQELYPLLANLRDLLPLTAAGYTGYGVVGFFIALLLMFGPTFCAGMTLPLLTRAALARSGERALGSIYAWNTAGAIVGVVLAVLLLLPVLGLKFAVGFGAALDLALGVLLLGVAQPRRMPWGLAAALALLAVMFVLPGFSRRLLSSGPYRLGYEASLLDEEDRILFYRDGSTISIAVELAGKQRDIVSLRSNGRGEGSYVIGTIVPGGNSDAYDNVVNASLGMLYHPDAKQAAVIGYGTGLTTTTLLSSDRLERVTTLEIEPAVLEAGAFFPAAAAAAARDDPRSELLVIDAKQYFANRRGKPLDIIVSIPSHPWVSGVANLFTKEHFATMRTALADDGVLVQWLHLYEMETTSLATVLEAVASVFPNYVTYLSGSNIAIVTSADPRRLREIPADALQKLPGVAAALAQFSIHSVNDVAALSLADQDRLQPYINSFHIPANSDYFPLLDIHAPRAFFLRLSHGIVPAAKDLGNYFVPEFLPGRNGREPFAPVSPSAWSGVQDSVSKALALLDHSVPLTESISTGQGGADYRPEQFAAFVANPCPPGEDSEIDELAGLVAVINATSHLYQQEMARVWQRMEAELPCLAKLSASASSGLAVDFFKARAQGDHAGVLLAGAELLPQETPIVSMTQARVLLGMMSAAMQLDEPKKALLLSFRIPVTAPASVRHAVRMLGAHAVLLAEKSPG